MRGKGLVMPPFHERMEEQAKNQPELDAMYNELFSRSAPASYSAVSAGLYNNHYIFKGREVQLFSENYLTLSSATLILAMIFQDWSPLSRTREIVALVLLFPPQVRL